MFDNLQFRKYIIQPALYGIGQYTPEDEELLVGICAKESLGGTYFEQLGGGPAEGFFQMQPDTHELIWNSVLPHNTKLTHDLLVTSYLLTRPKPEMMRVNLIYAAAMCRIYFMRQGIPATPKTLEGQVQHWKTYYNTVMGKGTVEEYISSYKRFVNFEGEGNHVTQVDSRSNQGNGRKRA